MFQIFLLFVPVLMVVVLANLGQLYDWARWLTYAVLLFAALLTMAAGAAALFYHDALPSGLIPPGFAPDWDSVGRWLLLGGGLALAIVLTAIALQALHREPRLGRVLWVQPISLTAIVLAVLFAGLNLAQSALIGDRGALEAIDRTLGLAELGAQSLGFVLLGFLGAGLGIRRSLRATLDRLGLRPLLLPGDVVKVVTATFGMLALSIFVGGVLTLAAPDSVAAASAVNQLIIGSISTPAGAVLLGLFSGVGEEVLYRGAVQPAFGLWLTSFIFAIHHIQYLNFALIVVFLLGLALGWVRNRHGTTVAALVHASYNTILVLLALASAGLQPA